MDPRAFRIEKHGSARFSGRKTWIRALFGSKNIDPRDFRVEKHGSAGSIRWALCHVFDLGLPPNAPKRLAQCHVLFSNPRLLTKTQTQSDDPFRRYLYHFPLCYLLVCDRINLASHSDHEWSPTQQIVTNWHRRVALSGPPP